MCVQGGHVRLAVAATLAAVLAGGLLAGCGAAGEPGAGGASSASPSVGSSASPSPSVSPSASPSDSPSASPSIPADGVTLRSLGFANGPLDAFSVPVGSVLTDRVDQPNAVTLVLSAPTGSALLDYYRRTLPAAGFRITADDPATRTMIFTGQGWNGVLTGTGEVTAVALRPA